MADNEAISRDRNVYNFQTEVRVRLSETDALGIVFFGNFAAYMDVGRMDYLNHLGLAMDGKVPTLPPGAVVSSAMSFHAPARYNDVLLIHVRIAELGRTSYTFHLMIEQKRDRNVVSTGEITLVWLDDAFEPTEIPASFRETIRGFEGENVREIWTATTL